MDIQNNTYESLLEETQTKKIIVFGCGKYFENFLSCYPALSAKIEVILDNGRGRDNYIYGDLHIPVTLPKEIKRIDIQKYTVVFCAVRWREMKKQLDEITGGGYSYFHYPIDVDYRKAKELGIKHRIIIPALKILREHSMVGKALELTGIQSEEQLLQRLERKEIHTIPRLVVVLTPRCSLRCRDCNNLMWAFSNKNTGGGAWRYSIRNSYSIAVQNHRGVRFYSLC